MVEILAGNGIELAFKALNIPATRTYQRQVFDKYDEQYEVWQMDETTFNRLCEVTDKEWDSDWGWWRQCGGSNMGPVYDVYTINGQPIKAWDGISREQWCDSCTEECDKTDEDKLDCYGERKYSNLFRYSCDEIGASTEKNFCAITTDLAQQNGIALGELFQKCMP